ncbi:hypothetical protein [Streptomyces sp. NPDC060001]|uniref:hypothetical protein n=1 Tax=Streptomyces sp. NPDC060001 TaxID=3347032 RepID=UPI0036B9BC8C
MRCDSDTEVARQRTFAVVGALPDAYRGGLMHQRPMSLFHSIPAQHHRESAVRELRDVLAG